MSKLTERVLAGDRVAISKSISEVENGGPEAAELLETLYPYTGRAFVIGVTGPPGTGKSSLVDRLARTYRSKGSSVAILAVDPTSPVTGGAILGDRVRMLDHALDPGVYIRSMASRGDEGGLSRAARNAIRILDAAGNHVIFVETVGIGQAEVEIVQVADIVVVVLMPELGDEVQAAKAGLMEVGDIFAVNKTDLPGSDKVIYNLQSILSKRGDWTQASVKVSAKTGEGLDELFSLVERYREGFRKSEESRKRKSENLTKELVRNVAFVLSESAEKALMNNPLFARTVAEVTERKLDPETATRILLREIIGELSSRESPKERTRKR